MPRSWETRRDAALGLAKALDAVGVEHARDAAVRFEIVEVRERLADRKAQLMRVERAPEEHREQLGGGARVAEGIERLRQARVVMRAERVEPVVEPAERQAVRRQHERVGRKRTEARERLEIEAER